MLLSLTSVVPKYLWPPTMVGAVVVTGAFRAIMADKQRRVAMTDDMTLLGTLVAVIEVTSCWMARGLARTVVGNTEGEGQW